MDAPVPLIAAALLAAVALVTPSARGRAAALLGALAVAAVILLFHVAQTEQVQPLRDSPAVAAALVAAGLVVVAMLAWLFDRRPSALPVVAVAALPFRVPIAAGGSTVNLLVPLYVVVAAGAVAYAVPRLAGRERPEVGRRAGALEWALAAYLTVYAAQSAYSSDFARALENMVFFYVPFAVLFVLVSRVAWTLRLASRCLLLLAALALVFASIGFVEYATRHLLLNPKVIASNQVADYFRVNSLFFDPNIYGRFLAVVMLLLTAWLLWARRGRDVAVAAMLLGILWAGLVLTFSQSSFASLLVGLAVLGALRWSPRRALALSGAALAAAAGFVALAPGALRLELGSARSADAATSGRYRLIQGGAELFADRPVSGYGSGAFASQYRRVEKVSAQRATAASHTIPVTVAAEQGLVGLALYLAVLACALARMLRGARRSPPRAAVAAAFCAVLAHTMMYAAFLEDPLTWTLLAAGTTLPAVAVLARAPERAPAPAQAPAPAAV